MPAKVVGGFLEIAGGEMTQGERRQSRFNKVKTFIEANLRNPSKYAPEEELMVHSLKRGRKLMNAGDLKPERVKLLEKLFALQKKQTSKPIYIKV